MDSKPIQCRFESDPGHFSLFSKVTRHRVTFTRFGEQFPNAALERIARRSIERMYDLATRRNALALLSDGRSLNSVSKQTGISRAAPRSAPGRSESTP
jgi:hypothetical protein